MLFISYDINSCGDGNQRERILEYKDIIQKTKKQSFLTGEEEDQVADDALRRASTLVPDETDCEPPAVK